MLCRQARHAVIDRELGATVPPERATAVERHLERCTRCRAEADTASVTGDLARLRGLNAPLEIDVLEHVMRRVSAMRPVTDELPLRQWILIATAAVIGGVVILGALWDLTPRLAEPAQSLLGVLDAGRGLAAGLVASLVSLLAIPFKLLGSLAESLWAMKTVLNRLAPVGVALTGVATAVMSCTVVYFVGRDLRARPVDGTARFPRF